MDKKIVEELLEKAFVETERRMEIGYKHPMEFESCWKTIEEGHRFILSEISDLLGMYEFCVQASKKYPRYHAIGADHSFSTVICQMGIQHESSDWYRIMAYHYERRAEQEDLRHDIE